MYDYTKQNCFIVIANQPLIDWLLSLNTHNRIIKKQHIALLEKQINDGHWFLTNQGIGVSESGYLTDGQHRLIAIKNAGYPPVPFVLITGLSDKAQSVVDTHAKRNQADVIRLFLNVTISTKIVAAINVCLNISHGENGFYMPYKKFGGATDTFDVSEHFVTYQDTWKALFNACGTRIRSGVMAALFEYAIRYSVDSACNLGASIKDGVNLEKNDPAYKLRAWLQSASQNNGAHGQIVAYALTVTACIAHASGKPLGLLRESMSWDRLPKPKSA